MMPISQPKETSRRPSWGREDSEAGQGELNEAAIRDHLQGILTLTLSLCLGAAAAP
jgi:hypothetical protein